MSLSRAEVKDPSINGNPVKGRSPFQSLAYASPDGVIFGLAPRPVSCGLGLRIGAGEVLPEVDFTLTPMSITPQTWSEVQKQYQQMVKGVLARALHLKCGALGLEIEHLYELTMEPRWGAELTKQAKAIMEGAYQKHGLRTALRVTVADVRQEERPPKMRTGKGLQKMMEALQLCAASGADIFSVESTGGKELFDQAIVEGDVLAMVYSLGVLGCRDVRFLWRHITEIATRFGVLPGGDSACAFANTAMQLAQQKYIPKVLAALIRALSAVRTLCAFEEGALGPGKDCAYENPIIKIITGMPVAMEGKSAACAHSCPLGNISAAVCDLWANESVQNLRLLGGDAPEVCAEMLIYDCRLMNTSHHLGQSQLLRNLFVSSDRYQDPQALFLDPEVCFSLAQTIVAEADDYLRTLKVASYACQVIQQAVGSGRLHLSTGEVRWLGRIEEAVASLPDSPDGLWERLEQRWGHLVLPTEYGLG